jgi:hypothetical protein
MHRSDMPAFADALEFLPSLAKEAEATMDTLVANSVLLIVATTVLLLWVCRCGT